MTVTGIAKGSGMIRPDMATMLAFIATDAAVAPGALRTMAREAVEASFNRITVDGDTSTNDACVLVATAGAGNPPIETATPEFAALAEAAGDVALRLAHAIVRDGEGGDEVRHRGSDRGRGSIRMPRRRPIPSRTLRW